MTRKIVLLLLGLLFLPIFAVVAGAQTPVPSPTPISTAPYYPAPTYPPLYYPSVPAPLQYIPLDLGQSYEGIMRGNETFVGYTFNGVAGQALNLKLEWRDAPATYAPRIAVVDFTQRLSYREFYATTANGTIGVYVLPYTDTYELQIYADYPTPYDRPYTLTISEVETRPATLNEPLEGELSLEQSAVVFSLTATEGNAIVFSAKTTAAYPFFLLLDSNGREVISASGYNGAVTMGPLNLTGDYKLLFYNTEFMPGSATYTVTIGEIVAAPIAYGETVESSLVTGQSEYYSFEAAAGDIIDIEVVGENGLDTMLSLLNTDLYGVIITDDDSGSRLNPEILRFAIGQTGLYSVQVNALVGEGDYTLSLNRSPDAILGDEPRRITFIKPGFNIFSFSASAGETLRLTVEVITGNTTPYINIMNNNTPLVSLSPTQVTRISTDFTVPSDGSYLLYIDPSGYGVQEVEITLERVE